MNEKIQEHIEVILKALIDSVKATVDFTKEQVPLLVHEILRYEMYSSSLLCVLYFLLFLTMCILGVKLIRKGIKQEDIDYAIPSIFLILFSLIPMVFSVIKFMTILKINMAPRLYLLEYLSDLINK